MSKIGVFVHKDGKAVFEIREVQDGAPAKGEVLVQNIAIGVNDFDDILLSRVASGEIVEVFPGYEGCGRVIDVGEGVDFLQNGDIVCYLSPKGRACGTRVLVEAGYVIKKAEGINEKAAASLFLKSMLAHALVARTYMVQDAINVLIQDIGSPIGQIIAQFAKSREAKKVIGTVLSGAELEKVAELQSIRELGLEKAILDVNSANFKQEVFEITKGEGAYVVYDGVGEKEILLKSLDCLCPFGMLVSYGYTTARISSISMEAIAKKSLFFSAPSVFEYKKMREEMVLTAVDFFDMYHRGALKVGYREFSFDKFGEAVSELRKSTNSIIISF